MYAGKTGLIHWEYTQIVKEMLNAAHELLIRPIDTLVPDMMLEYVIPVQGKEINQRSINRNYKRKLTAAKESYGGDC